MSFQHLTVVSGEVDQLTKFLELVSSFQGSFHNAILCKNQICSNVFVNTQYGVQWCYMNENIAFQNVCIY